MLALNSGLHVIGRERRRHRDRTTRLLAFVDAFTEATALGLKEHDRPALAREQMLRRTRSRRGNSKLPPHNPFQQIRIERCVPPAVQVSAPPLSIMHHSCSKHPASIMRRRRMLAR
ncbi:DUF1612 domain-containing protein, partial [Mesorhizobium sp. M0998]